MSSPYVWAERVYGQAELGDKRRSRRLVHVAGTLAAKPLSSFCQAYPRWSEIKGAYRFIANGAISIEALEEPGIRATVDACRHQGCILAVGDTSSLNFTNHRATQGLGPIGEAYVQGIMLHSTIALRWDGVPLGILGQEAWVRDPKEYGKHHQCGKRAFKDKESYRWVRGIVKSSSAIDVLKEDERPYIIHIFDREGDIHEVFESVLELGDGAVIRSAWNRRVKNPCEYLHKQVLASPVLGKGEMDVPRKQGEKRRKAVVTYRACSARLNPPRIHRDRKVLDLNIVAVIEEDPPVGVEPLKWFLITTEPIDMLADVLEVVRLYKLRWRIEEYHLILKSGCRIEKVQFESAERIKKLVTLMAPVAIRILQLTYLARTDSDLPCTAILNENEWRALQTHIKGEPPPKATDPPSLKQAVLWIGRLGGHLGRKSDGMPGVRSLWKGWRDLQLLTTMFIACNTGFNHLQ